MRPRSRIGLALSTGPWPASWLFASQPSRRARASCGTWPRSWRWWTWKSLTTTMATRVAKPEEAKERWPSTTNASTDKDPRRDRKALAQASSDRLTNWFNITSGFSYLQKGALARNWRESRDLISTSFEWCMWRCGEHLSWHEISSSSTCHTGTRIHSHRKSKMRMIVASRFPCWRKTTRHPMFVIRWPLAIVMFSLWLVIDCFYSKKTTIIGHSSKAKSLKASKLIRSKSWRTSNRIQRTRSRFVYWKEGILLQNHQTVVTRKSQWECNGISTIKISFRCFKYSFVSVALTSTKS